MDYKEKYKSLSDYDLIEIIKNEDEFDSIAISEAKSELNFRNVDFDGIIEEENNKAIESKVNKQQKRLSFKNKIKDFINKHNVEVEDYLHNDILNKSINIFVGILILMFLYDLFKNISFIITLMFDSEESNYWISLGLLFPYLYQPMMIYFFWKRSKIGWYLVNLYFIYNLQIYIAAFFSNYKLFLMDSYFILYVFFYILVLISLNNKITINLFKINTKKLIYFYVVSIISFVVFFSYGLYKLLIM